MLRWSELTEQQKKKICNGCGAKGGVIPVPDFIFGESCDIHDFYYWRGHTETDRYLADEAFLRAMYRAIEQGFWLYRWHRRIIARRYYEAVRNFGKGSFHYGPRYRTRSEIDG